MLLHAIHALHQSSQDPDLAVDTDVVLALSVAHSLGPEYELWLDLELASSSDSWQPIKYQVGSVLRRHMHSTLNGCDTAFSFVEHG